MPKKTTNKKVRGSKESLIQPFFINLSLELFVFCLIDNHSLHPKGFHDQCFNCVCGSACIMIVDISENHGQV